MLIEEPAPHRCTTPQIEVYKDVEIWDTKTTSRGKEIRLNRRTISEFDHNLHVGTIYRCEECLRWWVLVPGDWADAYWTRVAWHHRKAHRKIKDLRMPDESGGVNARLMAVGTLVTLMFMALLAALITWVL